MTKQSKSLKQEQPIAVAVEGQAPVIPFAPYQCDSEYETEYSETLLSKSNELARTIWGNVKSYEASKVPSRRRFGVTAVSNAAEQNDKFFSRPNVSSLIESTFSITSRGQDRWSQARKVTDFIKKLKKLERQHGSDALFDDDDHDLIVQTILMPESQFGVPEYFHERDIGLQFPTRPAVVNGIFTVDEITILELIINYIPTIRIVLQGYKPWNDDVTEETLLKPLFSSKAGGQFGHISAIEERDSLRRLRDVHAFFGRVMPSLLIEDHIPQVRYPSKASQTLTMLQMKSASLRDTAASYVQYKKPLSELLEKIIELAQALKDYFHAVVSEVDAYFEYLNRIEMTYEMLVKESSRRIQEGDVPW